MWGGCFVFISVSSVGEREERGVGLWMEENRWGRLPARHQGVGRGKGSWAPMPSFCLMDVKVAERSDTVFNMQALTTAVMLYSGIALLLSYYL